MSKILIDNLGPVEHFEEDVDDKLLILIGEQASGKSTIAKAVFFCKGIAEEFKKYLMDSDIILSMSDKGLITGFQKRMRTRFIEFFGTTKHMRPFKIQYEFSNHETVIIELETGYARINFSKQLAQKCLEIANTVKVFYVKQKVLDANQALNLNLWLDRSDKVIKMIDMEVNNIFGQTYSTLFIPAGRSMLATNSEFFHTSKPNKYDILMNDFIDRITIMQKQYSQKLEDIVRDKKKLSTEVIDFDNVNKAKKIIRKILKGDYVNERDGEKIYFTEDRFVKLVQASSGQQEALWIVLMIFSVILNNQKVFLVIEEPEAHLFPKAQKEMMELISLMINATGSKVLLTTHSPYILTAANLVMYSSHVEKDKKTENDVVPYEYRISADHVSAYMLRNEEKFETIDLMDRENSMIDASKIDTVSEDLNIATDRLIELEIKQ